MRKIINLVSTKKIINVNPNYKQNKRLLFFIIFLCFLLTGCSSKDKVPHHENNVAVIVSVSTDGKFALSSHLNQQLVLWNLQKRTYRVVTKHANIYSAYFIKNSDNFMWQNDANNNVYIENVNGKMLRQFNPGFATYGQVITSDLKNYYAGNQNWDLFTRIGGKIRIIQKGFLSFLGIGKLLNLSLSDNNQLLVTSGYGGDEFEDVPLNKAKGRINLDNVAVWNAKTGKPLKKFAKNKSLTYAALSPDGEYVVSGDVGGQGYVWYSKAGKLKYKLWDLWAGKCIGEDPKTQILKYDDNRLKIKPPKDFIGINGEDSATILAIKFIDNTHYLRFTTHFPYAILYSVNSPQPLKYFPLGKKPFPAVNEYVRDQAIDTTPQGHILVMGQAVGNGIIVYKYSPKNQTLKKIWVGDFKEH